MVVVSFLCVLVSPSLNHNMFIFSGKIVSNVIFLTGTTVFLTFLTSVLRFGARYVYSSNASCCCCVDVCWLMTFACSFFFTKLVNKGQYQYKNVARWTKNVWSYFTIFSLLYFPSYHDTSIRTKSTCCRYPSCLVKWRFTCLSPSFPFPPLPSSSLLFPRFPSL